MLILTIINALPVKQRMKNAFLENHIFTEYNLLIVYTGIFHFSTVCMCSFVSGSVILVSKSEISGIKIFRRMIFQRRGGRQQTI